MSNFTRITLPTRGSGFLRKLLSVILLTPTAVFLSAWSFQDGEEKVTIKGSDVPLITVFKTIKKQTGYSFFYAADYVNDQVKVSVDVKNVKVEDVLRKVLGGDYVWVYNENAVSITKKKEEVRRRSSLASASVNDSSVTQITVSGSVVDAKGMPIPGATVLVKGTKDGANTDENGKFSLPGVATNAVLVISSVGFERREIQVKGKTILAKLNINVSDLDEAVVVAYNTTTQRTNTGAVTVVKGDEIQSLPTRSIDRALQGFVPGLQVTSGSGLPGGGVASITLRGIGTGGEGIARNPLYVLDGVILTQENFSSIRGTNILDVYNSPYSTNPMAQINPNDIESITVLKDAAAIALYGSQASNGVILITTKKGKQGKMQLNVRHQTDISGPVKRQRQTLNQEQYLDLLYESYKNADPVLWTDQAIFEDLKNKFPYQVVNGDTSFYPAPNWFDALYRNSALTVSSDVSLSAGNERMTHYLSLGHLSQDGALRNTGFDRYSVRYNINMKPVLWFNLGINSSMTYTHQDFEADESITSPNGFGYYVSPLLPIYQNNGRYMLQYPYGAGGGTVPNPVAALEYNQNIANAYRGTGNIFAEVAFLKYFSFKTSVGVDLLIANTRSNIDKRVDQFLMGGSLTQVNQTRSTLITNNIIRYDRSFAKDHSIGLMLGQEAQIIKSNESSAQGTGFNSGTSTDDISSATSRTSTGIVTKATFLSYFGQANYEYRRKYLASLGIRLDGSSRFGAEVPLKKYWSFGAGWILSEEPFIKNTVAWMDFLKLRGSVGIAGNTIAIPPNTRSNRVTGIIYSNNPSTYGPSVELIHGNPNVKPESTFNIDMGLETRLWNDRISLTADIYRRKTFDMVTSIPRPFISGQSSYFTNLGDIENKGIELSLSIDLIKNKDFVWNINGNWSANNNRLTKAYNPETLSGNYINKVQENFNSWYLVRWGGVDPADGSAQWLDKDGKATKSYGYNDRQLVGKPQPDGYGAFNIDLRYKNVKLGVFFYYTYGYKVLNTYWQSMMNDGTWEPYSNQSVLALDRWQKPGDLALNPKRVLNNPVWTTDISTRYLVDGDYIRLKNIMLSYSLDKLSKRYHLSGIEVFMQGNNLALWTKSDDIDPDNTGTLGENAAAYPQQRSYSIGVNLKF